MHRFPAFIAAILVTGSAYAQDIMIDDPYARSATAKSVTGAAFMVLTNQTDANDRLIAARSDVAERVELHTHLEDANGVMRMIEVEDGFALPAGETHMLRRGGDHIMFMGLKRPLLQDEVVQVTLTFEQAGDIVVDIPVDNQRKPTHGHMHHGG